MKLSDSFEEVQSFFYTKLNIYIYSIGVKNLLDIVALAEQRLCLS